MNYTLFISNTFASNTRPKLTKIQAKAKQYSGVELLLFENYSLSPSALLSKNNLHIQKNVQKTSAPILMRLYD